MKKITEDDIVVVSYSIGIPSLNDKVVDEGFAYCLGVDLHENNFYHKWVSLDDMGYISVSFDNLIITQEQIDAVIKYANENI